MKIKVKNVKTKFYNVFIKGILSPTIFLNIQELSIHGQSYFTLSLIILKQISDTDHLIHEYLIKYL